MFFTFREERDFQEMFLAIDHFIDSHNAASFPKNVGRHCAKCDYCLPCHGARPFLKSLPDGLPNAPAMMEVVASQIMEAEKQLCLKIKVGRRKKVEIAAEPISGPPVIRELPVVSELNL